MQSEKIWQFSKADLDIILPAHIGVDRRGTVLSIGPTLAARYPVLELHSNIQDHFDFQSVGIGVEACSIVTQGSHVRLISRASCLQLDGYKWISGDGAIYAVSFFAGSEMSNPAQMFSEYSKVPSNAESFIEHQMRVGLLGDMRELVASEALANQKSREQTANVQLIAGLISHDLINYLSLIMSSLVTLSGAAKSGLESEKLARGVESTNLAVLLCRSMMDIVGNPRRIVETAEIDAALIDMEVLLRGLLEPSVMLTMRLGAPCARVRCDRAGLTSCLVNLVKNAVEELTDSGGKIEIKTLMRLNESDGRSEVVITITNSLGRSGGNQLELLGTEFYSSKRSEGGLGIAGVKRYCNEHTWEFQITTSQTLVVIAIVAPCA